MTTYYSIEGSTIRCTLCPHNCRIKEGQTGICRVRQNTGNSIELAVYGSISGYCLDPIEKKPLYHYYPGHKVLSLGSYGCNMRCDFCQNHTISQQVPRGKQTELSISEIITSALSTKNNIGIAFTYNEPVVWFEYMRDIAIAARKEGLHTVMVSNGYINRGPLTELLELIDAFNIDLKGFTDAFYRKLTGAAIEPVKDALKQIAASGKHLEVTTLIIPGQNDSEKDMEQQTGWMAGNLGKNVPLHLSRYFPVFKRNDPSTPAEVIEKLISVASENLDYVYTGNMSSSSGSNTICPDCGKVAAIRSGYNVSLLNIDSDGKCSNCKKMIFENLSISPATSH